MQKQINNKSFEGQTIYSGMDIHKKNWKVTILCGNIEHKQFNQNPDPEILANYLNRNFPGATYKAVYEAGFAGFGACRKLIELGVDCKVIHPADVPTTEKERLQKTDAVDSRKLAHSLREQQFAGIHIPDRILEVDRSLIRQRSRIVKDIARTKNRVKSLLMQFSIDIPEKFTQSQTKHWSKPFMEWLGKVELKEAVLGQVIKNYLSIGVGLRKELLLVNKQIKALSEEERYVKKLKLIRSVPGFGSIVGMYFLTQLGDISRFKTDDQLNNYVGLVPKMHGSGDKIRTGKLIKRGRKEMKIMLIEASWTASRKDPALMSKYVELSKRMHKNKAIIRIARKLLARVRYILSHEIEYVNGIIA